MFRDASVQNKLHVKNSIYFGDMDIMTAIVEELMRDKAKEPKETVTPVALKVCWGYASWGGTQLLAECAKLYSGGTIWSKVGFIVDFW